MPSSGIHLQWGDAGSIPGSGRSPGQKMATHSSVLAGKIQRTEEPGELQSMGSQRVGHDWETEQEQQSQQKIFNF